MRQVDKDVLDKAKRYAELENKFKGITPKNVREHVFEREEARLDLLRADKARSEAPAEEEPNHNEDDPLCEVYCPSCSTILDVRHGIEKGEINVVSKSHPAEAVVREMVE